MSKLQRKSPKELEAKCERLYQKAAYFAKSIDWNGWETSATIDSWNSKGERIMRRCERTAYLLPNHPF